MASGVEELEKLSDLCARIDFSAREAELGVGLLQPLACFVGAETASFRSLSGSEAAPQPSPVVSLGIPSSVDDSYLAHYFRLDPARRLLRRRFGRPLFAHPTRHGEWTQEWAAPAMLERYREEFLQYRREFLLPNDFYHHLGFCLQDSDDRVLLFDFHRGARSQTFGPLERARARVVALYLNATTAGRAQRSPRARDVDNRLSARELEVANAVALGLSNKEVAASLGISVRTVENHMRSIFAKLSVTTRTRLAARLRAAGGDGEPPRRTVA